MAASPVAEKSSNKTDTVVSRLNPTLRKALLQALNKYDAEASDTDDDTEGDSASTDPNDTSVPEILVSGDDINSRPIAVLNDQVASVQYHSVVVDSSNITASDNDNEIIRTIVVNSSDKLLSNNKINVDDESVNANRFDAKLDPTKDSNFANTDSLQVARSVGTAIRSNEIEGQSAKETNPSIKFTTSTTTTTTTTTEAPTHNEDGENIEKVRNDDVVIFQAPLVTAFTIQQDINGQAKKVFPIVNTNNRVSSQISFIPSQSLPTFESSIPAAPAPTMQPPIIPAQQFQQFQQPQIFNDISLQQKQQELQQQVLYLQQQQRQQEAVFRDQQLLLQRQAAQRQEQLLFEQRVRIEEDYKIKQQQYEQELRNFRQQQNDGRSNNNQFKSQQIVAQPQQFIQAPPLVQQQHQFAPQHQVFVQQLPVQHQQIQFFQSQQQQQQISKVRPETTSIQFIPSVSFAASFPISSQQLLPSKDFTDFRRAPQSIQFQSKPQQQQFNQPKQNVFQLNTNQELPQRPFQQFAQQNFNTAQSAPADTQSRNRVFREESGVGNFGFNNFADENQRQSNQFLQSLLQNSGFGRRQTEDLNIITKVLALNHGISDVNAFTPIDGQRQF